MRSRFDPTPREPGRVIYEGRIGAEGLLGLIEPIPAVEERNPTATAPPDPTR